MSQDSERIKRLVDFRQKLEKRVEELKSELNEQQAVLELVSQLLLEKGFRRPEIPKEEKIETPYVERAEGEILSPKVYAQPEEQSETVAELRAVDGELLARVHNDGKSLRVVPSEEKSFNVNTSPFGQFLVERVLTKMQERDSELARAGKIQLPDILSYNILRDGDVIREIVIRNVDSERLKELSSSIRWTFEKMYEKMKNEP